MDRTKPLTASAERMTPNSLYALLAQTAAQHGRRPAVEFGDQTLTYSQLLDRADRLAGHLAGRGARPGLRIAFCFRKSADALVALFAINRTGATYVPIDPAWPAERIGAIVNDAGITIWLGSAPPPAGVDGIELVIASVADGGCVSLGAACESNTMNGEPRMPAGDIANILYTSGSTGRPKGVEITTQSLLHFSRWGVDYFTITREDRLANHAPYNFDLSTFDIFAAVRASAAMIPVPESLRMFPYQMARFIADRRISVWYSVPSALIMMQLRGKLAEHNLSNLRHVIFAGEVMPKPALQSLRKELPHATWTNLYGPTETNVCTFHRCTEADFSSDGPVPIGDAITETRLWIMDESGCPVAEADAGELWVAGPTVTTGYFGDSALTQTKCVPAPDGRGYCYRTGDRVRRRADGVLLFEGRIDRMIKCRGHRIEPGEIEAALHRHSGVHQAAIVPLPDPVFGNRIRACVAAREGVTLDEPAMIDHCRKLLPSYMMPDEWHFCDRLPHTDRGKVDLQALLRMARA